MMLAHFFFFPFGFGTVMYFLPSIIALARSKRDLLAIFLLNMFLGWSVIGWVVARVWAAKNDAAAVARQLCAVNPWGARLRLAILAALGLSCWSQPPAAPAPDPETLLRAIPPASASQYDR